jgi:hypothetical protein
MQISQSDFENWKADPITKAFFLAADIRIAECAELLSVTAGMDSVQDNYLRGFIAAYREIPAFRVEDTNND